MKSKFFLQTISRVRRQHDARPHQLRAGGDHPRRDQGVHSGDQTLPETSPHRMRNLLPLGHRVQSSAGGADRAAGHARLGLRLLGQAHSHLQVQLFYFIVDFIFVQFLYFFYG